jgi:hypothetical protein
MRQQPAVAFIAGLGGLFTVVHLASAQPWAFGHYRPCVAMAGSADGSRLVAAAPAFYSYYGGLYPAPIFISTNAGASWTLTSCPYDAWAAVASSADGVKLVAVAAGTYTVGGSGLIYSSTNAGATWTSWSPPALSNNWSAVAASADGTKLVAASYFDYGGNGLIYASTNSGASWTATGARADYWTSIACSADGTKWVAVTGAHDQGTNGLLMGSVYSSSDSGVTWTRANAPSNNWTSVALTADGATWVAAAGTYYNDTNLVSAGGIYFSPDSGATWTRTGAPANPWFSVACSADGSTLLALRLGSAPVYVSSDGGETWTTGSPAYYWTVIVTSADGYRAVAANAYGSVCTLPYLGPWRLGEVTGNSYLGSIACSADGTKCVAAGNNLIYTSTNSGMNWRLTTAPTNGWGPVASSAKGTRLVAAAGADSLGNFGYGRIYFSGDAGATWKLANAPGSAWSAVAGSADGTKWVAAAIANTTGNFGTGRIYLSGDGGATWAPTAAPVAGWSAVASSADGTRLVAVSRFFDDNSLYDGSMFISTDSGTSWTQAAWFDDWTGVASSADGAKLVAATSVNGTRRTYISADGGASWAPTSVPAYGGSLASSADGTKLVAGVYISMDSGATWASSDTPAGINSTAVACSADGDNIFAAGGGPVGILRTPPPAPPFPHLRLSIGLTAANLDLSWLVPSTSFGLQQNSGPASANWGNVTNQPALNFSDLHNHVLLPPSWGNSFYRLKQQQP